MVRFLGVMGWVVMVLLLVGAFFLVEKVARAEPRGEIVAPPEVKLARKEGEIRLALFRKKKKEKEVPPPKVKEMPGIIDTVLSKRVETLNTQMLSFQAEVNRKLQYLNNQYASLGDRIALLNEGVKRLQERVKTVEDELVTGVVPGVNLGNQVATLSRELEELKGRLEAIEAAGVTLPGPEQPVTTPKAVAPGFRPAEYDLKASYQAALKDYYERKYDRALGEFLEIITMDPKSDLADNAQYWVGECYYGLGNFQQALAEFHKVFSYPQTDKGDDAQIKIAFCYVKLGDKEQALKEFRRVLADYPDSEYLSVAKAQMESLERK